MNDFNASDRDVTRAIRSWLHEDRHEDVSRIAGAVLDQVGTTRQRRATWWPARRTPTMNKFLAIGLGAAAVVVAIVGSSYAPNFRSEISDLKNTRADLPDAAQNQRIVVGSKDFTESVILAEILAQMLEKQGVEVVRQFELGGSLAHDGLVSGQIDAYPEYTGTAYTAILKHPPITNPQEVYDTTKAEYAEKFGLSVSPPLGFANDFAILVRGDVARAKGLRTISDAVPASREWQACRERRAGSRSRASG